MNFTLLSSCVVLVSVLFSGANTARANSLFTFEAIPSNTATPFTDTVNGLSATFGGKASVCNSDGLFQSLSGNVLAQQICGAATESGPLSISFSKNLVGINLNFATVAGPSTVTLAAFENMTAVASMSFTSAVPLGFANGEGVADFTGIFNRLTVTSNTLLAIDNLSASTTTPVPEPAALSIVFVGIGLLAAFVRRSIRINASKAADVVPISTH